MPWEQIVKGYEYDKDSYIVVDESAFEKASPDVFKSIEIEEFVDIAEVDTLYFNKPYFMLPDSKNKKAYVLLREALKKSKKVGIARVMLRTKEYLSLIFPHDDALILNLLHFKESIRDETELGFPKDDLKTYKISDREMKMALSLIKDMDAKWEPEKYHDDYTESLKKWLDKKTNEALKGSTKKSARTRHRDDVVDFITLLKQSMKKKPSKALPSKKKRLCRKNFSRLKTSLFCARLCRESIELFKNSLIGGLVMLFFSERVMQFNAG